MQVKHLIGLNSDYFEDLNGDTVIEAGVALLLPDRQQKEPSKSKPPPEVVWMHAHYLVLSMLCYRHLLNIQWN